MAGLDDSGLGQLAPLLIAVGALARFLAGLFGIGGGAILVPVFYECFGIAGVPLAVRMPLCVGTLSWKPVRQSEPLFADKDMRPIWNLRRSVRGQESGAAPPASRRM